MTIWNAACADLLDAHSDGLLCSANPSLNLSGGVGGAFSLRYGDAMQTFLHEYLRDKGLRYIEPGKAVIAPACGWPFKAIAHAVAIDACYDTTPELILQTYDSAIRALACAGCTTIAAACLGCGYGRVRSSEFVRLASKLFSSRYDGVECVTLMTTNDELAVAIRDAMAS